MADRSADVYRLKYLRSLNLVKPNDNIKIVQQDSQPVDSSFEINSPQYDQTLMY